MSAELAFVLNAELEGAPARTVLERMVKRFGERFAVVSSFGAESGVLLAIAADIDPNIPVLFLDTSFHFAQTLQHRDTLVKTFGLTNVISLGADEAQRQAEDPRNDLWKQSTDACCTLRKVTPLDTALQGYDAWATGRKRWQNAIRATMETIEWDGTHIKVNPLAGWSADEVEAFAKARKLPEHPLLPMGYTSIGCWPCTNAAVSADDQRSGRWVNENKTECGIHLLRANQAKAQPPISELADAI